MSFSMFFVPYFLPYSSIENGKTPWFQRPDLLQPGLREIPKLSWLWAAFPIGRFLTKCANNRNCSWWWYKSSRVYQMPPATQWSCLAKPALGILIGHMETAKIRNKAGDSACIGFLAMVDLESACTSEQLKSILFLQISSLLYYQHNPSHATF